MAYTDTVVFEGAAVAIVPVDLRGNELGVGTLVVSAGITGRSHASLRIGEITGRACLLFTAVRVVRRDFEDASYLRLALVNQDTGEEGPTFGSHTFTINIHNRTPVTSKVQRLGARFLALPDGRSAVQFDVVAIGSASGGE